MQLVWCRKRLQKVIEAAGVTLNQEIFLLNLKTIIPPSRNDDNFLLVRRGSSIRDITSPYRYVKTLIKRLHADKMVVDFGL